MDKVEALEGAGVEHSANLRVSLQYEHNEGAVSFFFGVPELNATEIVQLAKTVLEGKRAHTGRVLHQSQRARNSPIGRLAWQQRLWSTHPETRG